MWHLRFLCVLLQMTSSGCAWDSLVSLAQTTSMPAGSMSVPSSNSAYIPVEGEKEIKMELGCMRYVQQHTKTEKQRIKSVLLDYYSRVVAGVQTVECLHGDPSTAGEHCQRPVADGLGVWQQDYRDALRPSGRQGDLYTVLWDFDMPITNTVKFCCMQFLASFHTTCHKIYGTISSMRWDYCTNHIVIFHTRLSACVFRCSTGHSCRVRSRMGVCPSVARQRKWSTMLSALEDSNSIAMAPQPLWVNLTREIVFPTSPYRMWGQWLSFTSVDGRGAACPLTPACSWSWWTECSRTRYPPGTNLWRSCAGEHHLLELSAWESCYVSGRGRKQWGGTVLQS